MEGPDHSIPSGEFHMLRTNTEVCWERCSLSFLGNKLGNGFRAITDTSDWIDISINQKLAVSSYK